MNDLIPGKDPCRNWLGRAWAVGRWEEWIYENYRGPVLKWFRARFPEHDSEVACHEFFVRVVLRGRLASRHGPWQGNLRVQLRDALGRFAMNYFAGLQPGSAGLPETEENERMGSGSSEEFDRIWAQQVMDRAMARAEEFYACRGQLSHFLGLRAHLSASGERSSFAETAASLGMNQRECTFLLHRLRCVLRNAVLAEVHCCLGWRGDAGFRGGQG
jgi:hypothetical protein